MLATTTTTLSSLLLLLFFTTTPVTATPAYLEPPPTPQEQDRHYQGQHHLASAASERQPTAALVHDTFFPVNICNLSPLRISKSPSSGGHDLSAMLTFKFPSGTNCWLEFAAPAVSRGGRQVDVFTQWEVVDKCPSTTNARNVNIGRLEVPAGGGKAKWVSTFGNYLIGPNSPCPAPGTMQGIELVGVGDEVDIKWTQGSGKGLRVIYS